MILGSVIDRDINGLLNILINLNTTSTMDIFYYKYKNKIYRYIYQIKDFNDELIYCAGFSNSIGLTQEIYNNNIKNIFIILSYCLLLLKNKNIRNKIFDGMKDINKIKKIIVIFYYLNIIYIYHFVQEQQLFQKYIYLHYGINILILMVINHYTLMKI